MITWKNSIRSKFLGSLLKECVARGRSLRDSSTLHIIKENFEAVFQKKSYHRTLLQGISSLAYVLEQSWKFSYGIQREIDIVVLSLP